MGFFSNGMLHPVGAYFLMEAILASFTGIAALLLFIVIRRATRRSYFRRHNLLAFNIRKQWPAILSGVTESRAWREDPMQRAVVQDVALRELDAASPQERLRIQEFLRASGMLDACIEQARKGHGWQRRNALVTLGATLMREAIPALAEALADGQLETRLAAVRWLGRTELPQAADPILERLMANRLNIPAHPVSNALLRCCGTRPQMLLPYLRQSRGEVRELLARVAAEIASPEMADEMVLMAGDALPEVRACAARALAAAPLPLALPALAGLARDPVWFVRLRAVNSLDLLRHPRTIPILLEALCDSNRFVRLRSAAALSGFIRERTQILENVVDSHDRYALHAMISALELAGGFGKVIEQLSEPLHHDAAAERLLGALREGAATLWSADPESVLEKV